MNKNKKQFEVGEKESISECLARMAHEGYRPIKRMEKPIFKVVNNTGTSDYVPIGRKIIFLGEKNK